MPSLHRFLYIPSSLFVVVLALIIAMFSTGLSLPAQGQQPFREFVDSRTGIKLSLPPELLARQTTTQRGTNWSTSDKSINLDTLAFGEDRSLRRIYDILKGIRGRRFEQDRWSEVGFTIAGRDQDGSRFHVEVRRHGTRIRGYSLVYASDAATAARRIFERLGQSFEPFPDAQVEPRRGVPDPDAAVKVGEAAAALANQITVQPNLGEIGQDGGIEFSPDGKTIATSNRTHIKLWDIATGRPLRVLEHTAYFEAFTFIEQGHIILSVHKDGEARFWNPLTGRLLGSTRIDGMEPGNGIEEFRHHPAQEAIAFKAWNRPVLVWNYRKKETRKGIVLATSGAPKAGDAPKLAAKDATGSFAAIRDGKGLRIVKLAEGTTVSRLVGHGSSKFFPIASADGRQMMLHHKHEGFDDFAVWPVDGVTPRFHRVRLPDGFNALHAIPNADVVLGSDGKQRFITHSIRSGERVAAFSLTGIEEVQRARLSPDGRRILLTAQVAKSRESQTGSSMNATYLVDAMTGKVIRQFMPGRHRWAGIDVDPEPNAGAFAFSADGRQFAIGWWSFGVEIWSLESLTLIRRMDAPQTTSLTFSPDNRFLIGGSRDEGVFIWSTQTGALMRTLERESVAGHVNTGSVAISPDGELVAAGPGQRATSSGDIGRERRVQVWDMATGKPRFLLSGHEANVNALTFTTDGRWLVSGSNDGSIRYWDRRNGRLAATFATGADGRWVIVTEKGFFAASANAGELLSVVRGFEATSIEQMWQSLYAPDLVREHIAGDPSGEVQAAATSADLQKVLDSGPAPAISILRPQAGTSAGEMIDVEARITDNGQGIGRMEWRVNGLTQAVVAKVAGEGQSHAVSRQLALDPGDNVVEVVAYNSANLLASVPAKTTIKHAAPSEGVKPRLHVLVIGINAYVDKGWVPPGESAPISFPPLKLAVSDAEALGAALERAGAGQYDGVRVPKALNADATGASLEAIIHRMATEVHPRDTFVFFAAAHGTSRNGRFYLIPQDYDGGTNPLALQERAIGQERLQDWIVNRIKAKRSLILLDTCESGALVGGHSRSRMDVPASEAVIGRLHEATGRPVLTAAAEGQPAFEGYEGHGVFTWTLLDALKNGDRNANGSIELSELVAHVQNEVPTIAAKLNGRGRVAVAARGAGDDRQSARFGSRGEDFTLVRRLQ